MNELTFNVFIQLMPVWSLSFFSFIPLILKTINKNREPHQRVVLGIHFMGIFTSLGLFFLLGFDDRHPVLFSLRFGVFESGACVLAALAALQCIPLFSRNQWIDKNQLTESLFLFSHVLVGVYIFSLSQDLMTAFIGLETASLVLYLLIAFVPKAKFSLEASIKYFVLSSFAGILFLYGLSFIFGVSGDLAVAALGEAGNQFYRFFFLGLGFLLVGLLFKMSIFPFQFWLPDVYQGALTPVTSFMATGLKSAVILFIGRVFSPVFINNERAEILLMVLGMFSVLTVLFGNILALRQHFLKRLVAFSSLGHSGYLLMALVGIFSLKVPDFFPLFYYLSAYIFMTGGAFACIQCLEEKHFQPELKDLAGLFKTNPLFALGFSLFLLGLAGMPPFFGFFAKVALFKPLIASGHWWMLFWALVASAIGLYYYIKPLTYMSESSKRSPLHLSWNMKTLFVFCVMGTLLGAFLF